MSQSKWLKHIIESSTVADPDDVLETKQRLQDRGYYQTPAYGMTPYPDTPMFDGLKQFQKDNRLKVDGMMRPGGQTEKYLSITGPYKCSKCGVRHGGVYSLTICHQCWDRGER